MLLLVRAGQVEIVCVSHVASKSIPSTGLATHLSRHCKNVAVANLPMQHGCIAETLRAHAAIASLCQSAAWALEDDDFRGRASP
jgi:hypothetical protein